MQITLENHWKLKIGLKGKWEWSYSFSTHLWRKYPCQLHFLALKLSIQEDRAALRSMSSEHLEEGLDNRHYGEDFSAGLLSSSGRTHPRAQPHSLFHSMSLSHFSSQDCPSQAVLCCSCVYLLGSVLLRWADPRNQVTGQLFWHRQAMKHVLACGGFSVWQLGFIW